MHDHLRIGNIARVLIKYFITIVLITAACGSPDGRENQTTIDVVTTISPITSIVENIGGNRINLRGIIPEGVNSHTFNPPPSTAKTLASADLIVLNGLFLEETSLAMAKNVKTDVAVILLLGDQTLSKSEWAFDFSFPKDKGYPNPHLWPDPYLALKYAELVRDSLVSLDIANKDYYINNWNKFKERITEFDRAIQIGIDSIPISNRKLLTYHDSWPYFAKRYNLEVIGAVQPSDFSEATPKGVAVLIEQIRNLNLPAVFGSEVFSSKVLEQIARESGAEFIDNLSDDNLPGSPGDTGHSYLGLVLQNMETMITALGGDTESLETLDTSLVFDGPSRAIYPQ